VLSLLAAGVLVRDPEPRQSKAGKEYVTGLLRVPCDGEDALVSVIAFAAVAVQALLALGKGDSIAVTGRAKLTSWTKDGEEKHGISVVVESVLSAYQVEKRRSAATSKAPGPELDRVARGMESEGRAQVLTLPGGLAEMDDAPF
jgi:single-stranded DNA-binding protein